MTNTFQQGTIVEVVIPDPSTVNMANTFARGTVVKVILVDQNGNPSNFNTFLESLPKTNPNDGTPYLNNGVVTVSTALDPLTVSWMMRVASNGGTVTATQTSAVDAFAKSLRAAGLLPYLVLLNPRTGDYAASRVPLIGTLVEAHTGFTSADYSLTLGLTGTNNSTAKWLDTGLNPSTAGLTQSGGGLSFCVKNGATTAPNAGNVFGAADTSNNTMGAVPNYGGTTVLGTIYDYQNPNGAHPALTNSDVVTVTRASASDARVYWNGLQIGSTNTTPSSGGVPNATLQMFRTPSYNGSNYFNGSVTVSAVDIGLTSSGAANLDTAIKQLESALGR